METRGGMSLTTKGYGTTADTRTEEEKQQQQQQQPEAICYQFVCAAFTNLDLLRVRLNNETVRGMHRLWVYLSFVICMGCFLDEYAKWY